MHISKEQQLMHAQELIVQARIARAVERIAYILEATEPALDANLDWKAFKFEQNDRFDKMKEAVNNHASST